MQDSLDKEKAGERETIGRGHFRDPDFGNKFLWLGTSSEKKRDGSRDVTDQLLR